MSSANDLVAKLRLEAEADTSAIDKAVAANKALGQSGQQAAQGLGAAAAASQKLDQSASQAAAAAAREAAGLRLVHDADRQATAARTASTAAAGQAAAATARQAAGLTGLAGVARGAGTAMVGMAASFAGATIAGAALGVGAAALAVAANVLREEWNRAAQGMQDARDVLQQLQADGREAALLVGHLADETGRSASQADAAAGAYGRQALAAQLLNQKLREMNKLQLVDYVIKAEEDLKNIKTALRDNGPGSRFRTDKTEAANNARADLLKGLGFNGFGDATGAGRTEDQAIARARANTSSLSAEQKRLLNEFNRADATFGGVAAAARAKQQQIDAANRILNGQDDGVTLVDEVVIEAPRPKKTTAKGSSGGRQPAKTDAQRDAERRLDAARQMQVAARLETQALIERAAAAAQGEAALEALSVKEAGLQVLQRQGVMSLGELTGKVREETAAAIAAAEARERQAIATEKAERVGGALRDLDRSIAAEQRRATAIAGGTTALIAYGQAEQVRQNIERVGTTLLPAQVAELERKERLLLQIQAANDNADYYRAQAEELRLLQMTNDERDLEERKLRIINELKREGLEITEAEAEARALVEQGAYQNAEAIAGLKEDLRRAFIETGELSFDSVADYAGRKLREAVYDALLAEPIEVIIKAVVGNISGLAGQIGGGSGGLASLLGTSVLGSTLGATLSSAMIGNSIGKSMGLGSGKGGADAALSLGGAALGSAFAGTTLASSAASFVGTGLTSMGMGAGLASGITGLLGSAAVLGPLAAIAGLALGTLFKDDKRPYARADIGISGGAFSVTGGQQLDGGPLSEMEQAAAQITQSLNAAADLFKLDLSKVSNLPTSIGYVKGKNLGNLSEGYFGGDGGGFSTGAQFEGYSSAQALAADIVKATIIRAIDAGASDLSAAEQRVVKEAASLEDAANAIAAGRSIVESIDDAMLQLTNPAAFERKQALDAIEASYQALKTQAQELIAAGLVTGDVLGQLAELKDLQVAEALYQLAESANAAAGALGLGGTFQKSITDRILQLTDPAAFKVQELDATFSVKREQAGILIAAGLLSEDVYAQLDELQRLELSASLGEFSSAVDSAASSVERISNALVDWLAEMRLSPSAELSPAEERRVAKEQYDQALLAARGGDEDAKGDLTNFADRLLDADREATSSAQQRLALYQEIMNQVEGLAGVTQTVWGASAAVVSVTPPQNFVDLLNAQTASLSAANDQTLQALSSQLQATQSQTLQAVTELQSSGGGSAEALQAIAEALSAQASATDAMVREFNLLAAYLRQRSG